MPSESSASSFKDDCASFDVLSLKASHLGGGGAGSECLDDAQSHVEQLLPTLSTLVVIRTSHPFDVMWEFMIVNIITEIFFLNIFTSTRLW